MQGPYEKEGKWYFEAFGGLFGPYDTFEQCTKEMSDLFDAGPIGVCSTCKED